MVLAFWIFASTMKILREIQMKGKQSDAIFHQIESSIQLNNFVKPILPFPNTRNWVSSPDFLAVIVKNVLLKRPKVIVELGSGVSSLYGGYLLKQHHIEGKLYSVDHEIDYTKKAINLVKDHQLNDFVEVLHCPLVRQNINDHSWTWYDIDNIKLNEIDFLIIDGPPTNEVYNARYPAIPMFYKYLDSGAIILVDDYDRKGETEMVKKWLAEYPDLVFVEKLYTEKGTAVLMKK
ncbi:putative O-methyltransferase YrrM [Chryseobacterium defluvii]|uniref:Putative O-methyltransferase YrrM n=1 Tax=Chryseobacterium defluvii TaxID=160396 RepID=A0A840KA95_9FLAO|nr:class I SAM-dependent methyltransferase [Chryseobacterium defluvii]MBB4804744.1 putative O-methyltransferase YrrM [Chryseobacterium defluvii]